jgi:hypothetical protein
MRNQNNVWESEFFQDVSDFENLFSSVGWSRIRSIEPPLFSFVSPEEELM